MAIKLIAMDLDGTLLNSKKLISERNLKALQAAKARGVYITLATGRMYMAAAYFGGLIGANAPLICCNGAHVQAYDADQPVFMKLHDDNIAQEILALCRQKDWYVQWYVGDQIYAIDFRPEMFASYKTVEGFVVQAVGENYLPYVHDVIQIVVRDREGKVARIAGELKARFAGKIDVQQNTGYSVDLTPPGITKAVGIEALRLHLGVARDEIMVCGDADNDLAMLEYAGLSVVTENGLPEAKALADFVTASCDADGVGRAIEKYILQI